MNGGKNKLRPKTREPYGKVTDVGQVPIALQEMRELLKRSDINSAEVLTILDSIIAVTSANPGCLSEMAELKSLESKPPRVIVYDLEILNTIEQAGSWTAYDKMGIACICAYDPTYATWRVFSDLLPHDVQMVYEADPLKSFPAFANRVDYLVSFNGSKFDKRVCEANQLFWNTPDYDLLVEGWIGQGLDPNPAKHTPEYKGKLEDYAQANLGEGKTGNGALAPVLWQQGKYREVIDYCLNDVSLTWQLFQLSQSQGWLDNPATGKRSTFRKL